MNKWGPWNDVNEIDRGIVLRIRNAKKWKRNLLLLHFITLVLS